MSTVRGGSGEWTVPRFNVCFIRRSTTMTDIIHLSECMENVTVNNIYATTLALQALQTRLKRYLLYKDPIFALAALFT